MIIDGKECRVVPVVELSDDLAASIGRAIGCTPELARGFVRLAQRELGPQMGLVTREEMARQVQAAYREGFRASGDVCARWQNSAASARLEGGR